MRHLRRATGLLASVFMLHLVLVGSGFACLMPAMDTMHGAMDAMHGMAMNGPDQPVGGTDMTAMSGVYDSDESPTPAGTPCDFPWAPDGCQSTAPCAPTALTGACLVMGMAIVAHHDVASRAVLAPPSLHSPPELPPPRA